MVTCGLAGPSQFIVSNGSHTFHQRVLNIIMYLFIVYILIVLALYIYIYVYFLNKVV